MNQKVNRSGALMDKNEKDRVRGGEKKFDERFPRILYGIDNSFFHRVKLEAKSSVSRRDREVENLK